MTFLDIPKNASITRDIFDTSKNYNEVLFQKGKPVLDAELNELQQRQEDIFKFLFTKVGNLFEADAFKVAQSSLSTSNNFVVKSGNAIVKGLKVYNTDLEYSVQNPTKDVLKKFYWNNSIPVPTLTTPTGNRDDLVICNLVITELSSDEDTNLKDPNLNRETAIRWKINIGITVLEDYTGDITEFLNSFTYYNDQYCFRVPIAWLHRLDGNANIMTAMIEDIRYRRLTSTQTIFDSIEGNSADKVDGKDVDDSQTSASYIWTAARVIEYVQQILDEYDPQESIIDFWDASSALPSSPSLGDRYICSVAGNSWVLNHIYEREASSWRDITPQDGFLVRNQTDKNYYSYNSTSLEWEDISKIVSHLSLEDVTLADWTATNNELPRHTTDAQMKTIKDHLDNTNNPHSVSKEQITGLKISDSPSFAGAIIGNVDNTEIQTLNGITSNIQTQLNGKVDLTDYEDTDVLAKIKNVDGIGSGLDADLLQGYGIDLTGVLDNDLISFDTVNKKFKKGVGGASNISADGVRYLVCDIYYKAGDDSTVFNSIETCLDHIKNSGVEAIGSIYIRPKEDGSPWEINYALDPEDFDWSGLEIFIDKNTAIKTNQGTSDEEIWDYFYVFHTPPVEGIHFYCDIAEGERKGNDFYNGKDIVLFDSDGGYGGNNIYDTVADYEEYQDGSQWVAHFTTATTIEFEYNITEIRVFNHLETGIPEKHLYVGYFDASGNSTGSDQTTKIYFRGKILGERFKANIPVEIDYLVTVDNTNYLYLKNCKIGVLEYKCLNYFGNGTVDNIEIDVLLFSTTGTYTISQNQFSKIKIGSIKNGRLQLLGSFDNTYNFELLIDNIKESNQGDFRFIHHLVTAGKAYITKVYNSDEDTVYMDLGKVVVDCTYSSNNWSNNIKVKSIDIYVYTQSGGSIVNPTLYGVDRIGLALIKFSNSLREITLKAGHIGRIIILNSVTGNPTITLNGIVDSLVTSTQDYVIIKGGGHLKSINYNSGAGIKFQAFVGSVDASTVHSVFGNSDIYFKLGTTIADTVVQSKITCKDILTINGAEGASYSILDSLTLTCNKIVASQVYAKNLNSKEISGLPGYPSIITAAVISLDVNSSISDTTILANILGIAGTSASITNSNIITVDFNSDATITIVKSKISTVDRTGTATLNYDANSIIEDKVSGVKYGANISFNRVINDDTLGGETPSTLAAPTQASVKSYVSSLSEILSGLTNVMMFKGVIDCSTNPNYPAAIIGEVYKISVAGKIGGSEGINVEVNDTIICTSESVASGDQATVGQYWCVIQANIDGAVIGPASSASANIPIFDGVTGKLLFDSGRKFSDDGTFSGMTNENVPSELAIETRIDTKLSGYVESSALEDYYTKTEIDGAFVAATDYEDADVLTKIKNVDGTTSGLDADLLDGLHGNNNAITDNDTTYATKNKVKAYSDAMLRFLSIQGLNLSNNGDDLDNDIDFTEGYVVDSTFSHVIHVSACTGQLDAAFGTGNGMLRSGLTKAANTDYYIFALGKTTDATAGKIFADILKDPSANLPSGWDLWKLIGLCQTDNSTNIRKGTWWRKGDTFHFRYSIQVIDMGNVLVPGPDIRHLVTITAPKNSYADVLVRAANYDTQGSFLNWGATREEDYDVGMSNNYKMDLTSDWGVQISCIDSIFIDDNRQIFYRGYNTSHINLSISCIGWYYIL